ncbi:MFS transporter [Pectobacterium peruviense]|uniref:MFS transporter n=1 Tax=Pectobacterium peruviense TaxID=2066479 RepID=UPI000DE40646|nr:MFS transporter [Pectobacterium peruviense]
MTTKPAINKFALFGLMFIPGFTWATWVTRTPVMRDVLNASTETMGMILFGFSCGSMLGVLAAGKVINVLGIRKTMASGFLLLLLGLLVLAVSLSIRSTPSAFMGLLIFGAGVGLVDIAINIEGAAFEQHLNKSLMTTLHGFFSLGTLVGALAGMAMTAFGINTTLHFVVVVALSILAAILLMRQMPWLSDLASSGQEEKGNYKTQVFNELKDSRLLILGVVILAMALAEGSANDWLPLLMIDGHNFGHTTGTLVYVGFTAGMTLGRFAGGYFVDRFGKVNVLRFSAASAALGLTLVIFSDTPLLAAAAVIFWGIGASLGFPLTISAAGSGENSAVRVTIAATLGYFAFLVGPPALGFLGEVAGLRIAMLPVLVMVILAFICSSSARDRAARTASETAS